MKAVYYETHGGPEVLQIGERPIPEPGSNQVLVQVVAAAVNPIDRRLRAGELQEYITRTFPVVPGWDFSGRIAKVGNNVTDWQVGDDILGLAFTWSIQHGTYAEYVTVDVTADGVDVVLESLLGEGTAEAAIKITKSGGCVAYMNNEPPDMPEIAEKNIKAEFLHHRPDGEMLGALVAMYDKSLLLPHIEVMPLVRVNAIMNS